ncbi:MAG: hypothetical protein ACI9RP_002137 [Cyclobacteriaceae bacterium]|jgi:hypothetical protein
MRQILLPILLLSFFVLVGQNDQIRFQEDGPNQGKQEGALQSKNIKGNYLSWVVQSEVFVSGPLRNNAISGTNFMIKQLFA